MSFFVLPMSEQEIIQQYKTLLRQLEIELGDQPVATPSFWQPAPQLAPDVSVFARLEPEAVSLQQLEQSAYEFWKSRWDSRASDSDLLFWWRHLLTILDEAPRLLPETLHHIAAAKASPFWFFELRYAHQKEFAARTSRLYEFNHYLEELIRQQEAEVGQLHAVVSQWFQDFEEEALFRPYHHLIELHNLISRGLRSYTAKLTQADILQKLPELNQWIEELKQQIRQQLAVCKALTRQEIPLSSVRTNASELFAQLTFFRDMQSAILEQLRKNAASEQTLNEWLRNWEELENTIIYRTRGRLRAFQEIQERYRQRAAPTMEEARQQMYGIAQGVASHFLSQLDQAAVRHREEAPSPPPIKPDKGERFSWEDFKERYQREWRKELINESKAYQKTQLSAFRAQLSEMLTTAKQEITHIVEATREVLTDMVSEAKAELSKRQLSALEEQTQLHDFFAEIRQEMQGIVAAASASQQPFWEHYPALTHLQDIRQATEKQVAAAMQDVTQLTIVPTEVILLASPNWTRPQLERAAFAALVWQKQLEANIIYGKETIFRPDTQVSWLRNQFYLARAVERSVGAPTGVPQKVVRRIIFTPNPKPPIEQVRRYYEPLAEITHWFSPQLRQERGQVLRLSPKSFFLRGWIQDPGQMLAYLELGREALVRLNIDTPAH